MTLRNSFVLSCPLPLAIIEEDCRTQVQAADLKTLASSIPKLLEQARSHNTEERYKSGFKRWSEWCSKFPEVTVLPANSIHVALFLVSLVQSDRSIHVIQSSFCALKHYHKLACYDDPTSHSICLNIMEAAKRISQRPTNKKQPVTVSNIRDIYQHIGGIEANLLDLRNFTIILLGFAGFFRFNEIAQLRRCDISFYSEYMTIFIEKSKTDMYRDGHHSFIAMTNTDLCPVMNLRHYIAKAQIPDESDEFIFRSMTFFKSTNCYSLRKMNIPISYTTARDAVQSLFRQVGLDTKNFGLHSLRSGGATAAANNGISDRLFKRHGRWRSEKVKDSYVKDNIDALISVTLGLGL